jgi:hypothetical protein
VLLATEVLLAEKISPKDTAELSREFETVGLSAQLREVRPRRSLGEIAWLALMLLPLKPFFDKLAEDFADDAHQQLTKLVGKLLHRTNPATDTPQILVLQDSATGIQIVLESDLPPQAHQQLLSVDLTTIHPGPLRYDRYSGTWRSDRPDTHTSLHRTQ